MTPLYFQDLASYNVWANQKIISWLKELDAGQWKMKLISSFNSIEETTLHLAGAESVWADRLEEIVNPLWLPATFDGSREEMIDLWEKASFKLQSIARKANEKGLLKEVHFKRINGEENSMPQYQIFAHVFNHSSYHRGQVITQLRQAGFDQLSSTDLLLYYRNKKI